MFLYHGLPKLFGGPEKWEMLGGAMATFGITFIPAFWGFMAAISESLGGICLILGLFLRPACILLTITMLVAAVSHLSRGEGLGGAAHALKAGIVFLSLILIGPGKYSLDEKLSSDRGDDA
jgi:putative oxidoreductase